MNAYRVSFDLLEELQRVIPRAFRLVIPKQVKRELSEISKGGGETAAAARLALGLTSGIEVVPVEGDYGDEAILALVESLNGDVVVCTNDRDLKNILKARGVRVIGVRRNSHLDFL
jgi:hypothetical protein